MNNVYFLVVFMEFFCKRVSIIRELFGFELVSCLRENFWHLSNLEDEKTLQRVRKQGTVRIMRYSFKLSENAACSRVGVVDEWGAILFQAEYSVPREGQVLHAV